MEPTQVTQFARFKIPLEKVLEATNNFSKENIIGKGGFGNVYKGKLNHLGKSIRINARRLGRKQWQGEPEFWTEISMLSSIKYQKIVSLIGYCDEQGEKIIINHHYPKGSLSMHLDNPSTLRWDKRVDICYMVACAIYYIHNDLDKSYYIIHRNINSSTIVLDKKMNPYLSGFEHSVKHSVSRRDEVFLSEITGARGYIDPAIVKSGGVTHKSDIYSFGIVLFEMLCGRKANEVNKPLLGPLAKFHYENGTLEKITHPHLWEQITISKSFKFFAEAAYSCLHEDRTQRPDAGQLCAKLFEAYRLRFEDVQKMHEEIEKEEELRRKEGEMNRIPSRFWNPERNKMEEELRRKEDKINTIIPSRSWKVENLEQWRVNFNDVLLATTFSDKSVKFDGHSDDLYRTELLCNDREALILEEGLKKGELLKKYYYVMIKLIEKKAYRKKYGEEYSSPEIEVLSSCNHVNIELFLGFFEDNIWWVLVSKFVSTDYLISYLEEKTLSWEKRLNICLDVARGLRYLHHEMEDQKIVIHRDVNSKNVVLDKNNWSAKIVGFKNSVFLPPNQDDGALHLNKIAEKNHYMDPEYVETGKLKRESDVFSFGVIMLEILCGISVDRLMETGGSNDKDLADLARRWFEDKVFRRMMARMIKGENVENNFLLNNGISEKSLDTFIKIMCQCVSTKQNQRPTMTRVVKELEEALTYQEGDEDTLRMSFENIALATQNFKRVIGGGGFGKVYIGEVGQNTVVVKKLDKSLGQGEKQYYNELQILYEYKHENIIGLVGYSNETDTKIIVLEYASKGSLDNCLNDARLKWRNRLMICIDVATALSFLHGVVGEKEVVIHRDIKAANILLCDGWKAKLGDFGLSFISTLNKDTNYAIDRACGTQGYVDPLYFQSGFLTTESDIYSFGVVLFEILYGRAIYTIPKHESRDLLSFVKHKYEEGKQGDLVFEAIKEEIVSKSLTAFLNIVIKCLDGDRDKRPTSKEVLTLLKEALKLQDLC
ncbi:uncharacterized protein [Rutidosis leptorrhynchoides]|uniref:uncharacterized protein isoform X2 n=1 Tax=Rutidosis leptorrhynchoides TaxID=125765 RepID=UPI003A99AD32